MQLVGAQQTCVSSLGFVWVPLSFGLVWFPAEGRNRSEPVDTIKLVSTLYEAHAKPYKMQPKELHNLGDPVSLTMWDAVSF